MDELEKTFRSYFTNVAAYFLKKKILGAEPNETFMRLVEEKLGIPEQGADDFRTRILAMPPANLLMMEIEQIEDEYDWRTIVPGFEDAIKHANEKGY